MELEAGRSSVVAIVDEPGRVDSVLGFRESYSSLASTFVSE
jgi:hypothetical protein